VAAGHRPRSSVPACIAAREAGAANEAPNEKAPRNLAIPRHPVEAFPPGLASNLFISSDP
ncbi:MAG: hypothetical protein ACKVK6_07455, partial [bacterium]